MLSTELFGPLLKRAPNLNIVQYLTKSNDYFSEDFFEVLYISLGPKIKILEKCSDFLCGYAWMFLKSSNLELQNI